MGPTPKRSQPSTGWARFKTSKGFRGYWGA
jgi:hypothetical protein